MGLGSGEDSRSLGIRLSQKRQKLSLRTDLNRRPADYKMEKDKFANPLILGLASL